MCVCRLYFQTGFAHYQPYDHVLCRRGFAGCGYAWKDIDDNCSRLIRCNLECLSRRVLKPFLPILLKSCQNLLLRKNSTGDFVKLQVKYSNKYSRAIIPYFSITSTLYLLEVRPSPTWSHHKDLPPQTRRKKSARNFPYTPFRL